jgi:hypothetical protein
MVAIFMGPDLPVGVALTRLSDRRGVGLVEIVLRLSGCVNFDLDVRCTGFSRLPAGGTTNRIGRELRPLTMEPVGSI